MTHFGYYLTLGAVVLVVIIGTVVALYAWMTSPTKVLAEIDALDLDAATKAILKSCCESAKAADNKVRFYDLSAPIVSAPSAPSRSRAATATSWKFRSRVPRAPGARRRWPSAGR